MGCSISRARNRRYKSSFSASAHRIWLLSLQRRTASRTPSSPTSRLDAGGRNSRVSIPCISCGNLFLSRLTPGHGYLEALVEDNVTVVGHGIRRFTPDGIETTDGTLFKVDVIVCATGFDTTYRPSFNVLGRHGRDLRDVWAKEPRSYMSIAASGFPNYFSMFAPNTLPSSSSFTVLYF